MLNKSLINDGRRSGIVLLVVMAMLALFSTVALSFVFYAEAEATAARYAAQAQTQAQADTDPELLLSYFLSQLIYDTDNPYSAMLGHSLGRNMYGFNPADVNAVPFNGLGRLRWDVKNPTNNALKKNNMVLPNYQSYSNGMSLLNSAGKPRVPETDAAGNYVGGNVHWTYPDLNNMFLAAVNANGEVLIPSFHRPWLGVDFSNAAINDPWAKYSTLRPHISYHKDFVTPDWDGGGDVKNLEWGPGLRNGTGGYYNNDSIWMDLGFPVQTAPNGKRYKALFAPLIVDLDSKINLFVHGNIMNPDYPAKVNTPHFSNSGWGPWEVNMGKVLKPAADTTPPEWFNLFINNATIGKYGGNGNPDVAQVAGPLNNKPGAPDPPYWSKIDYGKDIGKGISYPGNVAPPFSTIYGYPNNKLQTYPDYPPGWDNAKGNPLETKYHAAGYNPFAAGSVDDKVALVMSHIEALYRFMGTGSPAMTSDALANLPLNMQNPRTRWLSTFRSMDLDRPGLYPYNGKNMTASSSSPASDYTINPNDLQPKTSIPTQNPPPQYPPSVAGGEFGPNGMRSNVSNPGGTTNLRALLNRNLSPYPAPNPKTGLINNTDLAKVQLAVGERQQMAKEIYKLLIQVTGARDPSAFAAMVAITPEYNAARWLAQLAVNIVDFIDEDDYMTPWVWNPNNSIDVLFGTELPHLLINEYYAEVDNDAGEKALWDTNAAKRTATNYLVNFWIELHNPFRTANPKVPSEANAIYPRDNGVVVLQGPSPGQVNYRVVVTTADKFDNQKGTFKDPEVNIRPAFGYQVVNKFTPLTALPYPAPTSTYSGLDYVDVPFSNPLGDPKKQGSPYTSTGKYHNGFYVMGPLLNKPPNTIPMQYQTNPTNYLNKTFVLDQNSAGVRDPGLDVSSDSTNQNFARFQGLSWSFPAAQAPEAKKYGIFLQRLANPNLPFDNTTNPYVTVDYVTNISDGNGLNKNIVYAPNGLYNPAPKNLNQLTSLGRLQPYVGGKWVAQTPDQGNANGAQHTLFRHNGKDVIQPIAGPTLAVPFYWPVHLDRQLVNPLELLNVSCYGPWEYTQRFGSPNGDHRAPWDQESALLYRFLELAQTPYPPNPATPGGRITGKININNIWDKEILDAILDSHDPSFNIDTIFQKFMTSRSPTVANVASPGVPGPTDDIDFAADGVTQPVANKNMPFKSLNVGSFPASTQFPNGLGMQNTILRKDPSSPTTRLFGVPDTVTTNNPYPGGFPFKTNEQLTKIYNNVTTRSNVFAVWLTVGFFEVVDESAYPVKLGAEIGRSENRQIRHRMFALIDRTNLMMPAGAKTTTAAKPGQGTIGLNQVTWTLNNPQNNPARVKVSYKIKPGMVLDINPLNANLKETITVLKVDYNLSTITANFTKAHPAGANVTVNSAGATFNPAVANSIFGNPGPQEGHFDPRQNTLVVPYFSIIQ